MFYLLEYMAGPKELTMNNFVHNYYRNISRRLIISIFSFSLLLYPVTAQDEYNFTKIYDGPDLTFLSKVFTGLDILEQVDFLPLQGKTIGLLCNQSSVNRNGKHILDLLTNQENISVKSIFEPEFGLFGNHAKEVILSGENEIEPLTGAGIFDLFGRYAIPPARSLEDLDLILIDIQDTGVRYTTFMTSITKMMEIASKTGIPVMVLDRPNPLRGDRVDGPVIRTEFQSYVGYHLVPIRHGLTVGEYSLLVNEMGWIKNLGRADLTIVPMVNWKRDMWHSKTGLPWVPLTPELIDLKTVHSYTGMALFQGTNLNIGQGTSKPYFRIGAPWISGRYLLEKINEFKIPGVKFNAIRFKPIAGLNDIFEPRFLGEVCEGLEIEIENMDVANPLAYATTILILIHHLYPQEFRWTQDGYADKLFGYDLLRTFAAQDKPPDYLPPLWFHEVHRFESFRQKFLLYP